jgi:hypothetical protein
VAETLADLVRIAMTRLDADSGRQLDIAIVRRFGEDRRISHTILNAILNGSYHSKPSASTVETLAAAAGVSQKRAFAAAGLPYLEPFHLPDSARELRGDQRNAVLAVIRALVAANRKSGERGHEYSLRSVGDTTDENRRAAKKGVAQQSRSVGDQSAAGEEDQRPLDDR